MPSRRAWPSLGRAVPLRLRRRGIAALGVLLAVLLALAVRTGPGPAYQGKEKGEEAAVRTVGVDGALRDAFTQLDTFRKQVDAGEVIPNFGERSQEIVARALKSAGSSERELELVLDRTLQGLFLRQAALLREQVVRSFASQKHQADTVAQAEEQFVSEAQGLIRSGSSWSLEPERKTLRAKLEGTVLRSAALAEEQARAARVQQVTINVIGKLQEQMEQLAQKVQGIRSGGSPWIFSTSYRVPNTPLQIAGRYEQGRANVELSLTPDKNPSDSEKSFLNSVGPAQFGMSFNLGI